MEVPARLATSAIVANRPHRDLFIPRLRQPAAILQARQIVAASYIDNLTLNA